MASSNSAQTYSLLEQSFRNSNSLKMQDTLPTTRDESSFGEIERAGGSSFATNDVPSTSNGKYNSQITPPPVVDGLLPPTPPSQNRSKKTDTVTNPSRRNKTFVNIDDSETPGLYSTTKGLDPPTPELTPPKPLKVLTPQASGTLPLMSSRAESFTTAREDQYSHDGVSMRNGLDPDSKLSRMHTWLDSTRNSSIEHLQEPPNISTPTEGTFWSGDIPSEETLHSLNEQNDYLHVNGGEHDVASAEWDQNIMRNVTVRRKRPKIGDSLGTQETPQRHLESSANPHDNFGINELALDDTPSGDPTEFADLLTNHQDMLNGYISDTAAKRLSGASSSSTVVEAIVVDNSPPQAQRRLRHVSKNLALGDEFSSRGSVGRYSLDSKSLSSHRAVEELNPSPKRSTYSGGSRDVSNGWHGSLRRKRASISPRLEPSSEVEQDSLEEEAPVETPELAQHERQDEVQHPVHDEAPYAGNAQDDKNTSKPQARDTANWNDIPEDFLAAPINRSAERKRKSLRQRRQPDRTVAGEDQNIRSVSDPSPVREHKEPSSPQVEATREVAMDTQRPLTLAPNGYGSVSSGKDESNSPELPTTKLRHVRRFSDMSAEEYATPRPSVDRTSVNRSSVNRWSFLTDSELASPQKLMFRSEDVPPSMHHLYTSFSPVSLKSGTPEAQIVEARAINLYPHHNNSITVLESPSKTQSRQQTFMLPPSPDDREDGPALDAIDTSNHNRVSRFNEAMDSPLVNPRDAPEPPVVKIIPPTPARELDNLHSVRPSPPNTQQGMPPARRTTLMQRARRYSDSLVQPLFAELSTLRRGMSLRRKDRLRTPNVSAPSQQDRNLHPFWRPRSFWDDLSDSGSDDYDDGYYDDANASPFDDESDTLPPGGDTSDVMPLDDEDVHKPDRSAQHAPPGLLHTWRRGGSLKGFLIGNSLGLERGPTNKRRHVVTLPASSTDRRRLPLRSTPRRTPPPPPPPPPPATAAAPPAPPPISPYNPWYPPRSPVRESVRSSDTLRSRRAYKASARRRGLASPSSSFHGLSSLGGWRAVRQRRDAVPLPRRNLVASESPPVSW